MHAQIKIYSDSEIIVLLRGHGINPTTQRVMIARQLFGRRNVHYSADDVFKLVNDGPQGVSKATVYNTLGLMAQKGVIREVIADPTKIFYDPNTAPHHHFYDVTHGELRDIESDKVQVTGLPSLPKDAALEGVDVIVRLRRVK